MPAKARIEKILPPTAASFVYQIKREGNFGAFWHYHPEYQLTLVLRGRGTRFVGDDVSPFKAGDLVLTGPNLPHMWCSPRPRVRGGRSQEAVLIQFPEAIFGEAFLRLPEMAPVRRLLERSALGIRFGEAAKKVWSGDNTKVLGHATSGPRRRKTNRPASTLVSTCS
jgi:hypothetical protein